MIGVLAQTLVWTGVLIAAVLLLRRPIARNFGPQVAYALWALPLARLLLPPITLPAWMRLPSPEASASASAAPLPAQAEVVWQTAADPVEIPPPAGFDLFAFLIDWPLLESLLLLWLGGAAVFLWRRFAAYFDLRDALLAGGREMGRIRMPLRTIRLVETQVTSAPLALGVLDPVIALPPGFMALHDRQARDLALAHELAHHRGGDLLVNVLVQPLFALHWWNPLARFGWMALRRDQEAACDARVMAHRDANERAAYAALIARYAAVPVANSNAALTAAMACPVLGGKSIIHRLTSLSMSEISPRRRLAGHALLCVGLLILPLTASISYAATEAAQTAPEVPEPPAPPATIKAPVAPDVPEGPDGPQLLLPRVAPNAPEPPKPPVQPEAPGALQAKTPNQEEGIRNSLELQYAFVRRGEDGEERLVTMSRRYTPLSDVAGRSTKMVYVLLLDDYGDGKGSKLIAEKRARAQEIAEANRTRIRSTLSPGLKILYKCSPGVEEHTRFDTDEDGNKVVVICENIWAARNARFLNQMRNEVMQDNSISEDLRTNLLREIDKSLLQP